jgi:hypothetical protein
LVLGAVLILSDCARSTTHTLGFSFDTGPWDLPAAAASLGTLSSEDLVVVERVARSELARAFSGLPVTITDSSRTFWRIEVVSTLPGRGPHPLPISGESMALGPLGGSGSVGLDIVALCAVRYAPSNATRRDVLEGIGRGVGRVAAHEFAHQIVGAMAHNTSDIDSYEYPSPERASQYYGQLHWTNAWPALQQKLR